MQNTQVWQFAKPVFYVIFIMRIKMVYGVANDEKNGVGIKTKKEK